ncbi:hypothetical protein F4808DRAFT_426478 [Astrocystis sublimbata]|nr:hypothetical protein F4808DRAFT_426478 [Astrocystis sublimbata]
MTRHATSSHSIKMARDAARFLSAAEPTLAENDSQDSQEKLLYLIHEHGIGVVSSSPALDNDPRRSIRGKGFTRAASSQPAVDGEKQSRQPQLQPQHLANPDLDIDAHAATDAVTTDTSLVRDTTQRSREPRYPAPNASSNPIPSSFARASPHDACPLDNPTSSPSRDHVITQPIIHAAPSKKAKAMSSQSPTQPNEGRSYEQYVADGSQPSSPPASFAEEHRTLQEGDTGYVSFKWPLDLPDTEPLEPDTPLPPNNEQSSLQDRSQFTSQQTATRTNRFAPETPAALPKPFLAGGNGQVLPPSQLFCQTQPTSGLRKASPTSSRPSPNVFENNVTSPTLPASSPLKHRGLDTSPLPVCVSPSSAMVAPSPWPLDRKMSRSPSLGEPLGAAEGPEEDEIDKTPLPKLASHHGRNRRDGRGGLEPIDEDRPYRKQISDRVVTRSSSQRSLDSDFDRDEAEIRRQRARLRKEKASKSFPDISVPPPSSGRAKIEVPSTNRAKQSKKAVRNDSEQYVAQCHGKTATGHDASQETVNDSQNPVIEQKSTDETSTPILPVNNNDGVHDDEDLDRPMGLPTGNMEDKEMIPETSPPPTLVEPPRLVCDILRENSGASSCLQSLSYPMPSAGASNEPSPSIVLASSQQSARRRSSRLNNSVTPSATAPEPLTPLDNATMSSTLTTLSATPALSSSLAPTTEDDHDVNTPEGTISVPSSAPETGRLRVPPPASLPLPSPSTKTKTYGRRQQRYRKGTRQSSRHSSLSLDELDGSPTAAVSDDSRGVKRKAVRKSTTLREFQTKSGLFEGMVFAISLQERQQPQKGKGKLPSKGNLEEMIRHEGGRILDDGFNALFEVDTLPTSMKAPDTPALSSSLNLLDSGTGFTALIADGHSRKVKYMQALALGIPCLAPKWISTCVSKKELVDWSSYLLCAGSSTLLGDAIRSRNLQPYDASTARLVEVITHRPKLLEASRILLMMKTKNEKRLPYVFLAQVLGASLVRVNHVDEARAKLREAESEGNPFDWVYVDDHLHDAKTALFGSSPSGGGSKKRKRTSTSSNEGDPPPKRIRTLNDELVIQSLILGRLVEEDEMED